MWDFKRFENNIAFISEDGRQITYRELDIFQKKYVDFMESERPFVFLICDTSVECILIYISCIQNRIPVMVLDNKLSKEKVADLIYAYQPDYIWDFGKQYFWEEYILEKSFQDFCLYHKTQNRVSVNEDLALVLLTSGSVGSKKGVRISYQNIESNMRSIAKSLELSEKDVAMVMLPMCYTYGLSVIHSNLSVGATLLVPKSQVFTARFWEFFKTYNGTSICGVPYTYQLLRRLGFHKKELPALRLITQAGGALGIEEQKYLLEYAKKHDVNVAIMYGQTEATARISCYFLNRHPEKIGSVGKVISGGVIEIESRESETEGEKEIYKKMKSKKDFLRSCFIAFCFCFAVVLLITWRVSDAETDKLQEKLEGTIFSELSHEIDKTEKEVYENEKYAIQMTDSVQTEGFYYCILAAWSKDGNQKKLAMDGEQLIWNADDKDNQCLSFGISPAITSSTKVYYQDGITYICYTGTYTEVRDNLKFVIDDSEKTSSVIKAKRTLAEISVAPKEVKEVTEKEIGENGNYNAFQQPDNSIIIYDGNRRYHISKLGIWLSDTAEVSEEELTLIYKNEKKVILKKNRVCWSSNDDAIYKCITLWESKNFISVKEIASIKIGNKSYEFK